MPTPTDHVQIQVSSRTEPQQQKYEKKKQIQVPNAATEKLESENQQRLEGQST
jgi:hypothetical protein